MDNDNTNMLRHSSTYNILQEMPKVNHHISFRFSHDRFIFSNTLNNINLR